MPSPDLLRALGRASAALQRGHGAEAKEILAPLLRSSALTRDDELSIRCALAEALLLQDDLGQATTVLGRPPDMLRERVEPARLSALWRLHAQAAFAAGERPRAIALLGRALKQAELAHDSRAIGLAHYQLGLCYKQVGDLALVRQHLTKASSALHAAGDRRYLALVHSLTATTLAQNGRIDEATNALREAEHLATLAEADDVLAIVVGNQANVAMLEHRLSQARRLAERSVALHEHSGSRHGLAVALASLGQFCVRLGDLERADELLHRALSIKSPIQLHDTTGAVYDTLAQVNLIRGSYDAAEEYLRQAGEAYGSYGRQVARWYEWSVRALTARLALRRGAVGEALRQAEEMSQAPGVPPAEAQQAELIACEALLAAGRAEAAEPRLSALGPQLKPSLTPGIWGEYLRVRASIHAHFGRHSDAYHASAQSVSVFEMLGDRYQAGLSRLTLGRLVAGEGARSIAQQHLGEAAHIFSDLGAEPDRREAEAAIAAIPFAGTGEFIGSPVDADDAVARRLVDAAVLSELLAVETAAVVLEATNGQAAAVFVELPGGDARVVAHSGCSREAARVLAESVVRRTTPPEAHIAVEAVGRARDGLRYAAVLSSRPVGHSVARRLRMIAAVAGQGFELCGARERPAPLPDAACGRLLEGLLPGFVCASEAMGRVVQEIERLQGNDLTALITGESGTGKELVARAIHFGSSRKAAPFLPYNCTTTTKDLADSQLFGHRRGSFTGAVADEPGLIRSAAGGSLFLDEIGDLPLDVQPRLLRFLEQGEVMPVGESRPLQVDVRVIAATNADLEQRVAQGRFREDLYYRLTVIRIHIPPLRERREEIPMLSALFLREASERLGKPDVQLGPETLDLFSQYWWPGNVRQLRNEIQRAVALSAPGNIVQPEHLSADLAATHGPASPVSPAAPRGGATTLAAAVESLERDLIRNALDRGSGNISEAARALGLTRRGLYLKLRRLGLETASELDTK